MTTPFWDNFKKAHNRDFLPYDFSETLPLESSAEDFQKELTTVRFNNQTLLDLIITQYQINTGNMPQSQQAELIKEHLTIDVIADLFKSELLSFCKDATTQSSFVETLCKITQSGLLRAAQQSLLRNPVINAQGFTVKNTDISTVTNIFEKDGVLYIDQKTELFTLTKTGSNIAIRNGDKSPLMTIGNTFQLTPEPNGTFSYTHNEPTIEHAHPLAESLCNTQSVSTVLQDIFSSIFRSADIHEAIATQDMSVRPGI